MIDALDIGLPRLADKYCNFDLFSIFAMATPITGKLLGGGGGGSGGGGGGLTKQDNNQETNVSISIGNAGLTASQPSLPDQQNASFATIAGYSAQSAAGGLNGIMTRHWPIIAVGTAALFLLYRNRVRG